MLRESELTMFETMTICICCGNKIVDRSPKAPNLCLACVEHDWHEMQDMLQELQKERLKPEEHNRFPKGRWS